METSKGGENEQHRPRFNDLVDEFLYRFSQDGWGNESYSDPDTRTWFARISIDRDELAEVMEAFEPQLEAAGYPADDYAAFIGHYLLVETADVVTVDEYDSQDELKRAYDVLKLRLRPWQGGEL